MVSLSSVIIIIKRKLKIGPQPLGHSLHGMIESKRQDSFQSHVTNTNGLRAPLGVGFDNCRIFRHCISVTVTRKSIFASKTFKYVCIQFAARKVEGGLV